MISRKLAIGMAVIFGSVLIAPAPAQAACGLCTCTTTATAMSFGNYSPISTTNTDSTNGVRVQCTLVLAIAGSFTVDLSTGRSGSYTQRTMGNGTSNLNYNLYTGATYNQIFGSGSGATPGVTQPLALITLLFSDQTVPVYGRIPAGQNVPVGTYTDTITVTVTY